MHYILLLLLLLSSLYAKNSDFSIIINKPFDDAVFDVKEDYDRAVSAVGFSKNFTPSRKKNTSYNNVFDYLGNLSKEYGSKIHLVKIDEYANIKLSKSRNLSQFNEAVSVIKTPSNGYFIGGYSLDGSMMLLKLDSDANILFTKIFGTKNYDKMNKLVPLRDGGVLAVGTSMSSRSHDDDVFNMGLGLNDISLTRFTKNGMKLWSKKFGTEFDDDGVDAVEASEGSIMLLGTTRDKERKDVTLMRISENGNKIWMNSYKAKSDIIPFKIIALRSDSFLLSLSQKNDAFKDQIRIIKVDLQKNTIADKIIPTAYSSRLKDIKEFSNSNLIGAGSVRDTYNTDALVMQLDTNLNLLCQEHFGEDNYDEFNSLDILHDSKVIAAGVHTAAESQESNMWIVKLNKDCTLAQKSSKDINIYDELLVLFDREIFIRGKTYDGKRYIMPTVDLK